MNYIVTDHALKRYCQDHRGASKLSVIEIFKNSIEIDPNLGRTLCGRFWKLSSKKGASYFRLFPDRDGEFVYNSWH